MDTDCFSELRGDISGNRVDGIGDFIKIDGAQEKGTGPRNIAAIGPNLEHSRFAARCTAVIDSRIVFVEQSRCVAQTDIREQLAKTKASSQYIALSRPVGADVIG